MDRATLKFDAKAAMKEASVSPYGVTVIMGIILVILSVIQTMLEQWQIFLDNDVSAASSEVFSFYGIFLVYFLIYFVISTILQFGYHTYCLKVANRDSTMSYGDLFCTVRYFFKALGLTFMIGLLITLWTCLLVIPGIIAEYRYSQAVFIMAEDPRKGIMQCIRESKEMMVGHKMDLFVLHLSFIPWLLLIVVTCGLGFIYVNPYMTVTLANFYNDLKPVRTFYQDPTIVG